MALKVGIIGVGGIANTHFPGWRDSPDAEAIALSDVVPETLHRVGDEQGIGIRYDNSQDLIANPDIDIIDICTPNMYHASLAIAAMEAGKHVLCEKPLAPTPDDIVAMIDARDRTGKMLMTAQHFRYDGRSKALKGALSEGLLGDVYHARSWMLRRAASPIRPGFIQKKHSGGGPCIDIGVHILDLTLWMMGHPKPVSVTGITQDKLIRNPGVWSIWGGPIPADQFDVEEMAAAFIRFDTGATLILEVSWLLHHKTDCEDMQMWIYGTQAGVHWPSNEILTSNYHEQRFNDWQVQQTEWGEPHAMECIAFADAVANGKPSPVPAEDSLHVITILDALYRSAESGREVRL